jgi:hypothetical protein
MPRGVAKAKDVGVDKEKSVGKKDGVVKRNRKMRGGNDTFFDKINEFITQNTSLFKKHKLAIIAVLEKSKEEYNKGKLRGIIPAKIDSNKSSRFKNTLKATIEYLNDIDNVGGKIPDIVKFPLFPVANELADVLLDMFKNEDELKDTNRRNDLILQFIYIKIYILFVEFQYFCNRINDIKNYKIVEPPKVKGVAELAAETAAKEKAEADLADIKLENVKVKNELADIKLENVKVKKELADKGVNDSSIVAELSEVKVENKKVKIDLGNANTAKDAANTKFKEAEEKFKLLEEKYKLLEDKILTIDEDYFKNALDEVEKNFNSREFTKVEKKIKAIIAIWEILRDDSVIKRDTNIQKIIEDIEKLNVENKDKLILSSAGFSGGGKRKINSSRTKRK